MRATFSGVSLTDNRLHTLSLLHHLDREVFYTLLEVRVLTEQYRQTYNRIRLHSSLGYRPPAPETILTENLIPVLVRLTLKMA